MGRLHTHYDNLRVARDASTQVIRAAYRSLAQKYHPDRNPAPDAQQVMRVLNEAWAILSDPARRREHDEWISEQEQGEAMSAALFAHMPPDRGQRPEPEPMWHDPQPVPMQQPLTRYERFAAWLRRAKWKPFVPLALGIAILLVWVMSPTAPYAPVPAHVAALSDQPANRWAPNGRPWPFYGAYVDGMPQQATGGLSKLTIDNSSGDSDVHVKLCAAGVKRCDGLRHVFVPRGESFTLAGLAPGQYELRYRNLTTGALAKSEPITVSQVVDVQGARYSVLRIALYRMTSGNTVFEPLAEDAF
jgi:curved DNA-binding protein CbpA